MPELVTRPSYPGLDERVRVFRHGTLVDSFAVTTERFIALIDTGERPEAMREVLEALSSDQPLLVVNTHGDWDHVWGNSLFQGSNAPYPAAIIGHMLVPERMRHQETNILPSSRAEKPDVYDQVHPTPPTILLTAGRLEGADLTLELIPTPGHTPDHLAIWIPEIRLLIAGDAAEMPFPAVNEDGSLSELRASLRRMIALNPETVLYCHAPGITSPELLRRNAEYFDALERHAVAGTLDSFTYEQALPDIEPGARIDHEYYGGTHQDNIQAASGR